MRVLCRLYRGSLFLPFFGAAVLAASAGLEISAEKTNLVFIIQTDAGPFSIVELAPFQSIDEATNAAPLFTFDKRSHAKIRLPRFDGPRDRIYSGFVAVQNGEPIGTMHFVSRWKDVSKHENTYPRVKSKKGLQVQMVDDALALDVKHAGLNFNLGQMVSLTPAANDLSWQMDGRTFHFRRSYMEAIDASVKALSDADVIVTLILLNYQGGNAELNKVLLHPRYDPSCPNNLSAFNTVTAEGVAWFKACMEFLADRYSAPGFPHGRVCNYIVGNEVNSHWWWSNMGHVSMEEFARDYLRAVRVCNTAVRKFSTSARVFISLEHHWNVRFAPGDETQSFSGRAFMEYFNQLGKSGGDFDWHVAFHPYPENLFEPRTWRDKSATYSELAPRITFKNIELLSAYLRQTELRWDGKPRRIILSEQGFHSDGTPEGERAQAAAYCYAYYKINRLEGIDSFILHRHVDHSAEGGLNLGLWRRAPTTVGTPEGKKPIYEVFRAADTPEWKQAFAFALPVIGIKSWNEINAQKRPGYSR